MNALSKCVLVAASALACGTCSGTPIAPTAGATLASAADIVGQMGVAFLNRFVSSTVSPADCLVDFSDSCRGKRDELADIEFNRAHFQILSARLGSPTVRVNATQTAADVAIPCAFDSRTIKCETADCVVGALTYVAGTCSLTGIREPSGWRLCTSGFSGTLINPAAQTFFGQPKN